MPIQIRQRACDQRGQMRVPFPLAQYLSPQVLQDLKMLTNFDMDSRDCFSLLLVGQSTLVQQLSRQPYEALRQRIVVHYQMAGLDEAASAAYVREMLSKAGGDPGIFDDAALASAHGASGGSVRRLNAVVTNALMIGMQQQARAVTAEMVRSAAEQAWLL
jgi:type II secretory pathway predicted ATPase ExeA